jgi:hypothetical protein
VFYAYCRYTECFYVRSHYVVHCCADYCYAGCRYTDFSHAKYHNLASMLPIVILTIKCFVSQFRQDDDYCYADYKMLCVAI